MKKITKTTRKLLVSHETVRRLSDQDMRAAKGGAIISQGGGCSGGWTCYQGTCNPSDLSICPTDAGC
jgi:hypothetical protein